MKTVSKEVYVETYVDVDVEIEISDVVEFIESADDNAIDRIVKVLSKLNVAVALAELDAETVRHLIERINIFGVDDMLNDLRREGERIGVCMRGDKS